MMVGRPVQLVVDQEPAKPGEPVLERAGTSSSATSAAMRRSTVWT